MYCVMPLSPLLCMSSSGRPKDGFVSRTGQTEEILSGRQSTLCKCRKTLSLLFRIKLSRFSCSLKVSKELREEWTKK